MDSLEEYLAAQLALRLHQGNLRKLPENIPGLKDFSSNDYLGLAHSDELKTRIDEKIKSITFRNGATGSRLLSGNSDHHDKLEHLLSKLLKAESTLLFNSGYAANTGVLSSIASKHDTLLYDERCHASIKDGVRLSLATKYSFKHNDLEDLSLKISRSKGRVFVVAESIYSMDGDLCPLRELVELSEKYSFHLILDEAHSTGIVGDGGSGLAVKLNVQHKISARIYTFGKAIGSHGACVAGSKTLIDYLINFSRPFIYTTALPDHTVIALAEAFKFIRLNPFLQSDLESKIKIFTSIVGANQKPSPTPIQTVILRNVDQTRAAAEKLRDKGFDIRPIFSPTVPAGKERLRICLHTFNRDEDITILANELNKLCQNIL